jgi:hypothetical protein
MAASIMLPLATKLLRWLLELLLGDAVLAKIKNWISGEKMLAWLLAIIGYMESHPLRSTAFIALIVLIVCAIGGYLESIKYHKPQRGNEESATPPPTLARVIGSTKVNVEMIPTSGPDADMLLEVKNLGPKECFRAQCRLLARRNDRNEVH